MNSNEFYDTYRRSSLVLEDAKAGTRYGMIVHSKPRNIYYTVEALQDGTAMISHGAFEVVDTNNNVLTEIFPKAGSVTVSLDNQSLHRLLPVKSKSSRRTRRSKPKSPIGSAKKSN